MSYLDNQGKNSPALEWTAMFAGVLVVLLSAYFIFGTNWTAYMVLNVVLGLGFIVFITYSFVNSKKLNNQISHYRATSRELNLELEKTLQRLSEAELEIKENALKIDQLQSELLNREETVLDEELVAEVGEQAS